MSDEKIDVLAVLPEVDVAIGNLRKKVGAWDAEPFAAIAEDTKWERPYIRACLRLVLELRSNVADAHGPTFTPAMAPRSSTTSHTRMTRGCSASTSQAMQAGATTTGAWSACTMSWPRPLLSLKKLLGRWTTENEMKFTSHAAIGSFLIGALLAIVGFDLMTWQFWAFILLCNGWYFTRPNPAV